MPGPGSTLRQCSSCCMSLNIACKTCKFCKAVQPRKLRLSKRTWVQAQKKNKTSSHLRDQAALVKSSSHRNAPTESSGNLSEEMYTLTLIPVPAECTHLPLSPSPASQAGKRKKGLPTERSSSPRLATSVANGYSSTTGEGIKKRNKGKKGANGLLAALRVM
ncbi:Meiosis-specific coiled-coil domain containing protein MEIOC, partial [Dissostichus eleginoides]